MTRAEGDNLNSDSLPGPVRHGADGSPMHAVLYSTGAGHWRFCSFLKRRPIVGHGL